MSKSSTLKFAQLSRDPSMGGLELLYAHYVAHSFSPHSHEEHLNGGSGWGQVSPLEQVRGWNRSKQFCARPQLEAWCILEL